MGYQGGVNTDAELLAEERQMLLAGFSYTEIGNATGRRVKTVSERNRLIHKVDIWEAFKRRVERDGVPCRLNVPDSFGHWFAGFFDGEGTITIWSRTSTRDARYREYRLSIRIMIRDDDAHIMTRIKDNLKVGNISRHKRNGNGNPAIAWICERVQDLAEVIIPLFDRYPLHTKKAKEYAVWKPVVMQRYVTTLAGYSNRRGIPEIERLAFHEALESVGTIRTYRPTAT